ncbi:MAG: hypothetical protein FWG90_12980 [Oscillospiraceae bacterium]|nr:hypothetical protein [Oscillospiraceae bacterium]
MNTVEYKSDTKVIAKYAIILYTTLIIVLVGFLMSRHNGTVPHDIFVLAIVFVVISAAAVPCVFVKLTITVTDTAVQCTRFKRHEHLLFEEYNFALHIQKGEGLKALLLSVFIPSANPKYFFDTYYLYADSKITGKRKTFLLYDFCALTVDELERDLFEYANEWNISCNRDIDF